MSEKINSIFSRIHKNYDVMNKIMSFGIDKRWRNLAARKIIDGVNENPRILDIATGTGDLAIAIYDLSKKLNKNIEMDAIDVNEQMMEIAKKKFGGRDINLRYGDALNIPYPPNSFDAVSVSFGTRNFDDLKLFGKELNRILKTGGFFVIMDMALPKKKFQRTFLKIYLQILRFFGYFIDKESYDWLVYSIAHFDFEKLKIILENSGFKDVEYKPMSFGITYVITGKKS